MRVLGVDPGLTRCGVGVVEGHPGRPLRMVEVGVIRTSTSLPPAERLLALQVELQSWVARH
ncbi:MAG: crossover junction endodeoxyribonuclease RuvC, partial [Actinomycetota bacterium]|nr:crossover junction endodeoxyribonuclease RuvC [Actinomycetota bacterium]